MLSAMRLPLLSAAACMAALLPSLGLSSPDQPPRKVIIGTAVQSFWGKFPGVDKRVQELGALVDRMAEQSQRRYGRGIDLAVLPETAIPGEISGDVVANSVPLGDIKQAFAQKARERHCYIVVPLYLLESREKRISTNAAVLFDRSGQVAGIYRKLHLAVHTASDSFEGGITPGKEAPVFNCDFGKLGIQICFDIEFDDGWKELARKGAEIIAWPTQSPQTARPAFRATQNGFYIVSSTWRHNASVFEPTGRIVSQVKPPENVLVQEVDLSYAILPWSPQLQNGKTLASRYGDKVGFRYYEEEDRGIFWSNDPRQSIQSMYKSLGLSTRDEELARIRILYDKAGVPKY